MLGFNLFAYCDNNPVNCVDPYGESGIGAALAGWTSSAWLLTLVDGPLPIGDAVYIGGIIVLGIIVIVEAAILAENVAEATDSEKKSGSDGKSVPEPPDVEYPGDDPTVAPGDDYEWVGKDKQGGKRGGYKNKNGKDSWHPDLDHPDGIEPHWDYNDGRGGKWRIFPNGIEKK